ncbi:hypothetical protein BCR39DRAFT_509777 [Naematelia encephala]|uniref:UBX domain-containing protein n=1 Tax=Naematelia encephala TaxID=71784 RepID=A0A1Y2BMQ7_9TREE|nr:hypothetical protein BCR39DRAFT_509777 [Naematelia encephala]
MDPSQPNELAPPIPEQGAAPTEVPVDGPSSSSPRAIAVYTPPPDPSTSQTPSDLDDTFFEPTISDVRAHQASVLARSRQLNDAPLLTSKYRDEEKSAKEKKRAEKWPETTIRVKFSDGTQIQSIFPSTSPIQPVYAFVRSALSPEVASKPFLLWQPPRTQYPEHPIPVKKKPNAYKTSIIPPANYGPVRGSLTQGLQNGTGGKETLHELGLVPQSVLLVKWDDETMNASGYPAPILDSLKAKSIPLPPTVPKSQSQPDDVKPAESREPAEKKIPKWLQKGLLKKKT